ncbi:MAG TPA: hypothetical protein VES97_00755 [Solirubrobacteraceae bacterium]|nr:hypothetical protein [Solirubrobacteraceae bacterium]
MTSPSSMPAVRAPATRRLLLPLACAVLALPWAAQTAGAAAGAVVVPSLQTGAAGTKANASATLEQCVTAVAQTERSATFSGEMTAIAGSARMEIRIDVLERMPAEPVFHTVTAPGLGVWRTAAPGVRVYKYLKQVTNLSAPAFYRASVRFRWLNARGRLIKALELRTPRCEQPEAPAASSSPMAVAPPPAGA